MKDWTVHVVDDDASVREALGALLEVEGYRVRSYASGASFLACAAPENGCLVLDLHLGDMHGQEVLASLNQRGCRLPVVVLTAHGDIPTAVALMRSGATDFLVKASDPMMLIERVGALFVESSQEMERPTEGWCATGWATLTPREREVLILAVRGFNTASIAEELMLSARTVEAHRSHIASKFEVASLNELFRRAGAELKALIEENPNSPESKNEPAESGE